MRLFTGPYRIMLPLEFLDALAFLFSPLTTNINCSSIAKNVSILGHPHTTRDSNVGPSPHHKGFKCLSQNGRIYISKDVTFQEDSFPFPSPFRSSESSPVSLRSEDTSNLPISVSESRSSPSSDGTVSVSSKSSTDSSPSVVSPLILPPPSPTEPISPLPDTTEPSGQVTEKATDPVSPPNILIT